MNQISLYNKSSDSKLSIEAEELTSSRNIKIPKDGSFLLTNKTRLTEDLADKYTVGPTGDFQELEEAVRVLCNMKEYSTRRGNVLVELQENYVFKSYHQVNMNAGFIVVRPKSTMTLNTADINTHAIFSLQQGAISPRFEQFTMNITSTGVRLFEVIHNARLSFNTCTFNFDYQDKQGTPLTFPLFLHYDSSVLVMDNTVINMTINKNNNTLLNSGKAMYRWLCVCGENSDTKLIGVKIIIEDKSNILDSSVTSVFPTGYHSRVMFNGPESLISYSGEHGGFVLISTHSNGSITLNNGLTLTGNSNSGNQISELVVANSLGSISCDSIKLKDCGTISNPIKYSFSVNTGGMMNINNCQSANLYVSNETSIRVNDLTRNGVIYK